MSTSPNLDRSLVQGIAWTGGVRWLTQLLSWVATLFVARLLTPTDFGLVGMAMIYMGLAQIVSDSGINAAIIQRRELTESQIAALNGLSVMVGIALFSITLALAAPLAWFFGEPALESVMQALSITFLTRSVQVVSRSLMARDLQFRRLAWVDGLEAMTLMLVTLLLAVTGAGHWALVLGALGSSVTTTALCVAWRPHRITFPRSLTSVADAATFGSQVLAYQLAWYFYSNADFLVVGRVLGKAALGTYSFAWTIASIPVDRVSGMVGRVTPAFFSAVQNDPASLRRYFLHVTDGLAIITMPACIGLAVVAPEFVQTMLGPQWSATATPLRLLAIYAAFRSIVVPAPQILLATGHARQTMYFSLVAAVVLPIAFLVGSRWGPVGVAMTWIVAYPAIAIGFFLRTAFRVMELKTRDYLRALAPALIATLGMCVALWLVRAMLPGHWAPAARLALQVGVGAATYGAIVFAAHASGLRTLRALLRNPRAEPNLPGPTWQSAERPERPRLLLISCHFPPDPAVGALRWQKLARYAANRGWGLDVISLDPGMLPTRDPERLADLPDGVRIYGVPVNHLHVESWVNAVRLGVDWPARLWAGIMGPSETNGASRPGSLALTELRWFPRESRDLLRAYAAWLEHGRYRRWAQNAARLALRIIDPATHRAVITCGPPHAAHLAGVEVSRRTNLPLVVDLRDPWSLVQRLPEGTASPVWYALAERDERRAIAQASLVVANTHPLRNAMRGKYPERADRIITVLNGFDEDPVPDSRPGNRFVVAYAGSVYLDRDPRLLFRAASRLITELGLTPAQFSIELMGSVATFDGQPLDRIAEEERVAPFVTLHRPRLRAEALEFLSRASVLVALPQDSDMAIPAKVFDYMRFDAWLLLLAARDSATALLLEPAGADVVTPGDVEGITNVLRHRYAEFCSGKRARRLAFEPRFSRRAQAETLFMALEQLAGAAVLPRVASASVPARAQRQQVEVLGNV